MYVNWHRSHKAKLVLSLLLVALTGAEIVAAAHLGGRAVAIGSPLGLAVVAGNPVVCLALSFYGLRISLGRQAVARASYVPDMLKTPPADVLESAAAHVAERARVIEVMGEGFQPDPATAGTGRGGAGVHPRVDLPQRRRPRPVRRVPARDLPRGVQARPDELAHPDGVRRPA
jgi:hypothetical protein